jgi:hypothetical protein
MRPIRVRLCNPVKALHYNTIISSPFSPFMLYHHMIYLHPVLDFYFTRLSLSMFKFLHAMSALLINYFVLFLGLFRSA